MRRTPSAGARVALALVAMLTVAAPVGIAGATHCESLIYLFSRTNVNGTGNPTAVSSVVGCTIGEEELNTDLIYPGSNEIKVRVLIGCGAAPCDAVTSASVTFSGLAGGSVTFTSFSPCTGVCAGAATDSDWAPIDPVSSINGGDADITVTFSDATTDSRTYRTIA